MYMELAEQKEETETRQKENMPKDRDYIREHEDAVKAAR